MVGARRPRNASQAPGDPVDATSDPSQGHRLPPISEPPSSDNVATSNPPPPTSNHPNQNDAPQIPSPLAPGTTRPRIPETVTSPSAPPLKKRAKGKSRALLPEPDVDITPQDISSAENIINHDQTGRPIPFGRNTFPTPSTAPFLPARSLFPGPFPVPTNFPPATNELAPSSSTPATTTSQMPPEQTAPPLPDPPTQPNALLPSPIINRNSPPLPIHRSPTLAAPDAAGDINVEIASARIQSAIQAAYEQGLLDAAANIGHDTSAPGKLISANWLRPIHAILYDHITTFMPHLTSFICTSYAHLLRYSPPTYLIVRMCSPDHMASPCALLHTNAL
jgi:hypothetical protein